MQKKLKELFGKLTNKQIVYCVIIIVLGIWMIINFVFSFKIPLPLGGYIECGSKPANVNVNYDKK